VFLKIGFHVEARMDYSLISFDEECSTSVVPTKKLKTSDNVPPKKGEVVEVLWESVLLSATFLMSGKFLCSERCM